MVTREEYLNNKWEHASSEQLANADVLLMHVNDLLARYEAATGRTVPVNPATRSNVSGSRDGDGGFRLPDSLTGTATSSHKEGKGVDIYDPHGELDSWVTDDVLEKCGLYREHPAKTVHWLHLTTRSPASGHRTFWP